MSGISQPPGRSPASTAAIPNSSVAPRPSPIPATSLHAFSNREFGLGPGFQSQDVWREWYDADDRVIVEIRERSWLPTAPDDVIDQRTCCVLRFRGDRICDMRDYTDSHIYEEFRRRHPELPRFRVA